MFDYENWLLNALYDCAAQLELECKIEVSSERSFSMPDDKSTLLFIVKKLSGSVLWDAIKVQPVQIVCYSEMNTMTMATQILDLFTKVYNNNSFSEDSALIKQTYDTVVTLRPFVQTDNSFRASLYTYGSLTIMEGIADVTDFEWYNNNIHNWEPIKPISVALSYTCVPNLQKSSGSNLSTTESQEATLTITLSVLQRQNDFCKLVNFISQGLSKQRKFGFRYKLQGQTIYQNAIMTTHGLTSTSVDAPALSLVFQV